MGMNKAHIEQKALDTLKKVQYKDDADSIDVIEVAQKLGFVVGNAMMDDDIDGFIIVEQGKEKILGSKTDKLIGVNAKKDLAWKRFIIAHEIGHYVLHYEENANNGMYAHRDHKKGKNEKENDVDFFAANLLMPRDKFCKKYNELAEKNLSRDEMIILLAEKFGVTRRMTERRLGEVGLDGQTKGL